MYNRADTCSLSGFDIDHFKTLAHRSQLPISSGTRERSRRAEGYSALDVLTLAVANALIAQAGYERGVQSSTAMPIAAAASEWIRTAYTRPHDPDIWAGMIGARVGRFEKGRVRAGWYVGGTLASITTEITREGQSDERGILRVFLVNVSEVIRDVKLRARRAQIFFPTDLSEAIAA